MSTIALKAKCPAGAPPWVTTFADLMSLLMCFFVLLLSFSEMDVQKYKQVAGSMREAFGVQREVEAKIMPKGTTVISQEFSSGKPTPTVIKEVRQQTTDDSKDNLDFTDSLYKGKGNEDAVQEGESQVPDPPPPVPRQALEIRHALRDEIDQGLLDVEILDGKTIIRIQEKGSFPSGSADLNPPFAPVMARISDVLAHTVGQIVVAGHTDDRPISTLRFRSNWDLSAARSVTVVHALLKHNAIQAHRFLVEGHADAQPLGTNDTPEGRAHNRRVEIVVEQPAGPSSGSHGAAGPLQGDHS